MFDNHLLMLKRLRIDVKLQITFLKLFSLTLEEELMILNDYDLLEDEYSYGVHLKTAQKNDKVDQIMKIQENITYDSQLINKKLNAVMDNQHTFETEIRNNSFAKHLKKIFKKNLKIPKVKVDDDDDSSSSSSSDDSDDSESEFENNKSDESLTTMGQFAVYHENVLPEGCDPTLFALTFKLRSERYEMEKYIDTKKKKIELSNKNLVKAYAELEIIENELKQNLTELEAYQIKKQLKLNDVDTTIVLKKSQMTKAKLIKNLILINGNVMQDLVNRVIELKKETEEIQKTFKKEKLKSKWSRTEVAKLKLDLKNYKVAIKDEILKKFKTIANWNFIDDMERTLINYMIICTNSNAKEITERYTKEMELLKKQIRYHQDMLTDLLGAQTIKNTTLKCVRKCNRQIQQLLIVQQKNIAKINNLSTIDNSNASDLGKLNDICNILSKRKENLCEEIKSLKHQGKIFPSIENRNMFIANRIYAKQSYSNSTVNVQDHLSIGDHLQLMNMPTTTPNESEELIMLKGETEEGDFYNLELNVEPKTLLVSSKQSLQLTNQSSQIDDDSSVNEKIGENERTLYYYEDEVVTPNDHIDDFTKIIDYDEVSDESLNYNQHLEENVEDGESINDVIDM